MSSKSQSTEDQLRSELDRACKRNRRDYRLAVKEIFPDASAAQLRKAVEAAQEFSAAEDRRWYEFNSTLDELNGVPDDIRHC